MGVVGVISATRATQADFWEKSPLGVSLRRLSADSRLNVCVAFENQRGLPEVYNSVINADFAHDYLVFLHDDVWIEDLFFCEQIIAGCQAFDVIGVAGNRSRAPRQISWAFLESRTWDDRANLSGRLAHGDEPFAPVDFFGPVPAECELLDGVLLAARKSVLTGNGVAFDPRFDFDFYDLDFCRTARAAGLRLGTWPISLTHRSGGNYLTSRWSESHQRYLEKWGE